MRESTHVIEETSKITAKGQTTVPKSVRRALGVDYGGKIAFRVERGRVTVRKCAPTTEHDDPVLLAFLKFLEKDIAAGNVKPLPKSLASKLKRIRNRKIDLDEPLVGDVDL
jgi:antitoxin PrlF